MQNFTGSPYHKQPDDLYLLRRDDFMMKVKEMNKQSDFTLLLNITGLSDLIPDLLSVSFQLELLAILIFATSNKLNTVNRAEKSSDWLSAVGRSIEDGDATCV